MAFVRENNRDVFHNLRKTNLKKSPKKHLHFLKKYTKLRLANKTYKNAKQKVSTLKKFEIGQLGVLARIKKIARCVKKIVRSFLKTHLPIKLYMV